MEQRLAVEIDTHPGELGPPERAVEGRRDRFVDLALLGGTEEADRVGGGAVDPEQRDTRPDAVRCAEQGPIAADGDDEVTAARRLVAPELVRRVVPVNAGPEVGQGVSRLFDGLDVVGVPGSHAAYGLVARFDQLEDAGIALFLDPLSPRRAFE